MLHQIEQYRCDSQIVRKDEDIEPDLSILALTVEKWRTFENEGVGGVWQKNLVLDRIPYVCQNESPVTPNIWP